MIEAHPQHERCLVWLQRARDGELDLLVAAHSVAELFAALSSYPTRPRLSPGVAARLVRENLSTHSRVVELSAADYWAVLQETADLSLAGGVVYDTLIARAARKGGAEKLVTLNPRDFLRVWPDGAGIIVEP